MKTKTDYKRFAHLCAPALARCVEEGDCLLWPGQTNNKGKSPEICRLIDGRQVKLQLRQIVYAATHPEVNVGAKFIVSAVGNERCDPRCIAPHHLKLWPRSKVVSMSYQNRTRSAAKIASNLRHPHTKLSFDKAAEIRASTDRAANIAARYGISVSRVNAIKRGEAWIAHLPSASIFTWRPGTTTELEAA